MILFVLVSSSMVYGQEDTTINATVKISVCGNIVAEGGEDCDNSDLKGSTCTSLGYGSGTLSCDISCSYDTSVCIASTPTPTAIPTTTSVSISTTSSSQPTVIPTSQPISLTPVVPQDFLPTALRKFDLNGGGRIDASELNSVLALWVSEWKQFLKAGLQNNNYACDFNQNGTCGLDDFSILLYYVEK